MCGIRSSVGLSHDLKIALQEVQMSKKVHFQANVRFSAFPFHICILDKLKLKRP